MAQGTIDQLNFEAIINHKGFDASIKAMEDAANKLNVNLSSILESLGKKGGSFANSIKSANTHLTSMTGLLRSVSQLTGAAFGVVGLKRFLSTLIDITGQFEVQKMALGAMLQDLGKADKIFGEYRKLALESPYTFQEFTKFGKQLTAFNIPAEDLVGTTKMLADVAAGLGVDMQRIILAYGQIKSAGVLKGMELRQLTEAGVPILDSLAKQIEKTTGKTVQLAEVFDMISKKQIPFAMVEQAFKDMTSEGGKFYNMQEVLVETLAGKIGKLKDTWQQALYDIGSAQSGILKGGVDLLTNLVSNYDKLGKVLLELVGVYGAYKVAMAIATTMAHGYTLAETVQIGVLIAAEKAQAMLNATILKNPYAIVAAAVAALVIAMVDFNKAASQSVNYNKTLKDVTQDFVGDLQTEKEELRHTFDRMEKLGASNEEYIRLKDRIISKYGEYLSDVEKENLAIGKLSGVYESLALSIEKVAMARAREAGEEDLQGQLSKTIQGITKKFNRAYGAGGWNEQSQSVREELLDYIFGRKSQDDLTKESRRFTNEANTLVNILRNQYSQAAKAVEKGEQALNDAFGARGKKDKGGGNASVILTDWQEKVKARLGGDEKMSNLFDFKENETWESYYTRMGGEYEKVTKDLLHAYNEADKKLYQERKVFLEALNKDFGGALLPGSKSYNKNVREGESEEAKATRERIAGIKAEIQVLQKYKQTYESMSGLLGSDIAKGVTNQIYGTNFTNFDFTSRIVELTDSLRALGDAAGADSVLSSLGLGEGKELEAKLKKAQQIAKTYRGLIEAWDAKDMDADDDTFFGKLTKIVSDLNTKSNELFLKFKKGKETLRGIDINDPTQRAAVVRGLMDEGMSEEAANEFWDTFVAKGETALTELYVNNLGKLRTNAQQSVNALADTWVKEQTKNMSLTQWGDKSIGQVYRLYKDLKTLAEGEGIDDKMKERLESNLLSIEDFCKLTKTEFRKLSKEAKEELEKKAIQTLKKFASEVGSLSTEIKNFAEASGKEGLAAVADGMSEIADVAGNVLEGFSQGGWIGAAVAGVTSIATGMLQAATEAERFKRELAEAAEEARVLTFKESLSSGVDSIFGEDNIKQLNNAADALKAIKKAISSLNKTTPGEFRTKNSFWYRFGHGFGHDNKYERYSLREMAESIGRGSDLYDEYGNLNSEVLQAILDKYDNLKESDKDWITQAMHNSEMYAAAMEQLDQVMESVVGDVATSAADTIVNGWIEARKAALDYTDILDDVAQSYSKMVIKSMILDDVLNEDAVKALKDAFISGDSAKAMSLVEENLKAVAGLEPVFQQVLETFDPYFKRDGSERSASSKALQTNFSQDTIDYWSGQLTLLVEYSRRGDEQRDALIGLVSRLGEGTASDPNYTANVQTYLAAIQGDTSAIRGDIRAMKMTIQDMGDKGVKMR